MNSVLLRVWTAVAGILALLFITTLLQYGALRSGYDSERSQADARARLYMAANGEELGNLSVERKLGVDVRAWASEHDGSLAGFRGDSNAYGGISDAIGEDPFNGVNCVECGPLKSDWEDRLERAVGGNADLDELIDRPTKPTNWANTVAGLLLVWLLFLPVLWGGSRYLDRRRRFAAYKAEDRQLIEALDRQLAQGRSDPELLNLRIGLRDALNERAAAGKTERTELLIEHLKGKARDRLDALEAGNEYLGRREK